jgi:hypothetical protein
LKIGHGLLINTERKEKKVIFSVIGLICAMGFFLFGLGRAQGAENVTSLTADILHAYGGRKVLENVRSVYMKGKIRAFAFDDKGTYEYYLKRGRKLRVNVRYMRVQAPGSLWFPASDTLASFINTNKSIYPTHF